MTAKDYRLIANVLASIVQEFQGQEIDALNFIRSIVFRFGAVLKTDNPRFKQEKFEQAVFRGINVK